jgi:Ser/Thr protein kinase RdoA (MazF antagonist)
VTEAEEAAGLWGAVWLRPVSLRENAVHAMRLPAGAVAALRLHRSGNRSSGGIAAEMRWTEALAAAGLPVAAPVPLPGGRHVARLASGQLASAILWLEGTPLAALPDPHQNPAALGRLIAQMHAVPHGLSPADLALRPQWTRDGIAGPTPGWGRFWEHPALSPDEARRLCTLRDRVAASLAEEEAHGLPPGLLHGDLLGDNVLRTQMGLALIDFDDCGPGPGLYDLATALVTQAGTADFSARGTALLEGYAAISDPGPGAERRLIAMVLARALASVGWTAGRLPPGDPKHRRYIDRALWVADRTG